MSGFYVTLPSTVKDFNELNTIGNYKTKLAEKLCFDNEWEVGLSDIIFPKSWFNVTSEQKVAVLRCNGQYMDSGFVIEPGHYEDKMELIHDINEKLQKTLYKEFKTLVFRSPELKYNKFSRCVEIVFGTLMSDQKVILFPILGDQLHSLLGFEVDFSKLVDYRITKEDNTKTTAECKNCENDIVLVQRPDGLHKTYKCGRAFDIAGGIHTMFVYTDVIKSSLVGDTHAQLLRVVPIGSAKFGETIRYSFDHPYYYPINSREIQIIEIDIKDHMGETIKFKEGSVTIVLHFRRNEFI